MPGARNPENEVNLTRQQAAALQRFGRFQSMESDVPHWDQADRASSIAGRLPEARDSSQSDTWAACIGLDSR